MFLSLWMSNFGRITVVNFIYRPVVIFLLTVFVYLKEVHIHLAAIVLVFVASTATASHISLCPCNPSLYVPVCLSVCLSVSLSVCLEAYICNLKSVTVLSFTFCLLILWWCLLSEIFFIICFEKGLPGIPGPPGPTGSKGEFVSKCFLCWQWYLRVYAYLSLLFDLTLVEVTLQIYLCCKALKSLEMWCGNQSLVRS